jgi:hypothetical protein
MRKGVFMNLLTVLRSLPNRQDREDVLKEIEEERGLIGYASDLRIALAQDELVNSLGEHFCLKFQSVRGDFKNYERVKEEALDQASCMTVCFEDGSALCLSHDFNSEVDILTRANSDEPA